MTNGWCFAMMQRVRLEALPFVVLAAFASVAATSRSPTDHAPASRPIIAAYERFHPSTAPSAAAGRLLLWELSRTACHRPADNVDLASKRGPILDGVGSRVSADWIRRYLADPQAAKPGTTMPDALAALPAEKRADAIDALTHLLASS